MSDEMFELFANMNTADRGADLLEGLNPEQQEAVLYDEGPLLILAGAGSGKTRVITRRIAYLIDVQRQSPYSILAITFTNKAANEMKQRINELIGEVAKTMWIGTFHAMFARILRRHADLLGYSSTFTIADTTDQLQMLKQLIRENELDEKRFDARMVLNQISAAKNALKGPDQMASAVGNHHNAQQIAALYEQYQRRLLQSNVMDFDDILVNTVKLFRTEKEVLEQYQQRFRYIMVDEYQDTNSAQYHIIKLLAAAHKNICVVGDDDQSIYSFRGADIRNILDFEKDYKNCRIIKLEQNYRSTDTILSAANAVIAHNKGRKSKKLWTGRHEGEAITFIRAQNHFDEARFMAMEIQRRMRADKQLRFADFALLYRANALSRNLEAALRENGVPYRIYGGLRFYDRKEIKDVLAYLRLVATDRDEISFMRAVGTPRRGIGDSTIENLQKLSASSGLPMLLLCADAHKYPELSRVAGRLHDFAQLIFSFRRVLAENKLNFRAYIEYVQEKSGLLNEILEQQEKGKEYAAERIENLKELLSDALEFSQSALVTEVDYFQAAEGAVDGFPASDSSSDPGEINLTDALQAFLTRASLYSEADMDNGDEDFVRLMTIHAAKGLEFRYVFLVSAEMNIFPSSRSMQEAAGMEEERRLAYVAITRAMEKLYITTARMRTLYGQTQANPVSIFVREIPEKYLEMLGGTVQREAEHFGRASVGKVAKQEKQAEPQRAQTPGLLKKASFGIDPAGLAFMKKNTQQGMSAAGNNRMLEEAKAGAGSEAKRRLLRPEDLRVGLRVLSGMFGRGVILSFQLVAGDAIVEIQFSGSRPKRLMLNMAKLSPDMG